MTVTRRVAIGAGLAAFSQLAFAGEGDTPSPLVIRTRTAFNERIGDKSFVSVSPLSKWRRFSEIFKKESDQEGEITISDHSIISAEKLRLAGYAPDFSVFGGYQVISTPQDGKPCDLKMVRHAESIKAVQYAPFSKLPAEFQRVVIASDGGADGLELLPHKRRINILTQLAQSKGVEHKGLNALNFVNKFGITLYNDRVYMEADHRIIAFFENARDAGVVYAARSIHKPSAEFSELGYGGYRGVASFKAPGNGAWNGNIHLSPDGQKVLLEVDTDYFAEARNRHKGLAHIFKDLTRQAISRHTLKESLPHKIFWSETNPLITAQLSAIRGNDPYVRFIGAAKEYQGPVGLG